MHFDWFTTPLIVSLLALWIARENFRRSNHVLIRLRDIHTNYTSSVSEGCYSRFVVEVQNVGVPLHDIAMVLSFTPGHGRGSIGLRTEMGQFVKAGQFHKGMITRFEIRSDKLKPGDAEFFRLLRDVDTQFVALTLFADSTQAWNYRFNRWGRRLMRYWNQLAVSINRRCWRRIGTNPEGGAIIHFYEPLPLFFDRGFHLMGFINQLAIGPFGPHTPPNATNMAGAWFDSDRSKL